MAFALSFLTACLLLGTDEWRFSALVGPVLLALACLHIATAYGVWHLRGWGRRLAIYLLRFGVTAECASVAPVVLSYPYFNGFSGFSADPLPSLVVTGVGFGPAILALTIALSSVVLTQGLLGFYFGGGFLLMYVAMTASGLSANFVLTWYLGKRTTKAMFASAEMQTPRPAPNQVDMAPHPQFDAYLSSVRQRLLADGFEIDEGLKAGGAPCDLFCHRAASRFGSTEYVYVSYFERPEVESAKEFLSWAENHARTYGPLPPPPNSLRLFQVMVTPGSGPEVENFVVSADRSRMWWGPWSSAHEHPVLVELEGHRLVQREVKGRAILGVQRERRKLAELASEYFSF